MVAAYSKPTTLPIWADTGIIVVPSGAKQSQGWLNTEKPPASFFNWYQQLNGSWMRWFDERLDDDPPKWLPLHAYGIGDRRANVGNSYIVTVAGTSAASGGPTGTGTGIVDGTVTWDYQAAASPNVFILKNPNTGTAQLRTLTAGGIQVDTGLNVGFSGSVVAGKIQVTAAGGTIEGSATGIMIQSGLNVGFAGTPIAGKIQVTAAGGTIEGSATGIMIQSGLNVGSASFPITADTIKVKDVDFGLVFSGNPIVVFDVDDFIFYNRGTDVFNFVVDTLTAAQFTTGTLGNTAGNSQSLSILEGLNTNVADLKTFLVRTTSGSSWQETATYIQNVTDVTYQNFVAFYGTNAVAPLTGWTGMTTAGVGIGAVSNSGPPVLSSPTVFVDSTKLYVGTKDFSLGLNGSQPEIIFSSTLSMILETTQSLIWKTSTNIRMRLFNDTNSTVLQLAYPTLGPTLSACSFTSGLGAHMLAITNVNTATASVSAVVGGAAANASMSVDNGTVWIIAQCGVGIARAEFLSGSFYVTTTNTFDPVEVGRNIGLWDTRDDISPTAEASGTAVMIRVVGHTVGTAIGNGSLCIPYSINAVGGVANILNVRITNQTNALLLGPAQGAIANTVRGWIAMQGYATFITRNTLAAALTSHLADTSGGTVGTASHVTGAPAYMIGIPIHNTNSGVEKHLVAREIQA